jgi:hypothetical protein
VSAVTLTAEQADVIRAGGNMLIVPGDTVRDPSLNAFLTPDSAPVPGFALVAPKMWTDLAGERAQLRVTCKACRGMGAAKFKNCVTCNAVGSVLVATASVEVLPVVGDGYIVPGRNYIEAVDGGEVVRWDCIDPSVDPEGHTSTFLFDAPDNQPVPGRDWVVVLTDIEVAP